MPGAAYTLGERRFSSRLIAVRGGKVMPAAAYTLGERRFSSRLIAVRGGK